MQLSSPDKPSCLWPFNSCSDSWSCVLRATLHRYPDHGVWSGSNLKLFNATLPCIRQKPNLKTPTFQLWVLSESAPLDLVICQRAFLGHCPPVVTMLADKLTFNFNSPLMCRQVQKAFFLQILTKSTTFLLSSGVNAFFLFLSFCLVIKFVKHFCPNF